MESLLFRVVISLVICLSLCVQDARACAMLTLVRDGEILFGNNEDYIRPGILWFEPGRRGRYGRVNVGFDSDFAQGSLNEKGLCFDSAALAPVPWEEDPKKSTPGNLIEKIMDECATVEEALSYFERFNCRHLAEAQFMFADATGASAVVAWVPGAGLSVVRRQDDALLMTNTRLELSSYRCARFVKASQVLESDAESPLAAVTDALNAIEQRGPRAFTSYSTIYDLARLKIYVYNLANFDEVVQFDLMEELGKRGREIKLADLFESEGALEALRAEPQRVEWDTRVTLPDETLARFVGRYRFEEATIVTVEQDGDGGLRVLAEGQNPAVLFPESENYFRIAPDRGQVSFQLDDAGGILGMTLHRQQDLFAERVDDR